MTSNTLNAGPETGSPFVEFLFYLVILNSLWNTIRMTSLLALVLIVYLVKLLESFFSWLKKTFLEVQSVILIIV